MRKDLREVVHMAKTNNLKVNYSKIARMYNCDPRTVKAYFERDETKTPERAKRVIKGILDDFKTIIDEKYLECHAPAIEIYYFLKTKYGYTGSYSTVKRYTHSLKDNRTIEASVRYETSPGLQCQIDWKENLTLYNKSNEEVTINIFLGILGYSRYKYIELTFDKTQPTLFKCLYNMFNYFGGVPRELLFDNMKTVVDRSRTQFSKVVFNDTLYQFSKDSGFTPLACLPFTPKTKGKVETVARIMDRLNTYNHEFDTVEELIDIIKDLLERLNNEESQTTREICKERYLKEKEYLSPLNNTDCLKKYFDAIPLTRKVPKDSMINYKENKYSVPEKYIGKTVTIEVIENYLHIYYNNIFITKHLISSKTFNYQLEHYKESMAHSIKDEKLLQKVCEENLKIFDKL